MKKKMSPRFKMITGLLLMAIGGGTYLLGSQTQSDRPIPTQTRTIKEVKNVAPVTVFFWYGCPHCKNLEQAFIDTDFPSQVSKMKGSDAAYEKVPAIVNELWELHARLYFALKKHGFSEQSHLGMMSQIQAHRPSSIEQIEGMLENHALKAERSVNPLFTALPSDITKSMYSPSVNREIEQAKQKTNAAKLHGVPTILVNSNQLVELGGSVGYQNAGEIALSILGKDHDQ